MDPPTGVERDGYCRVTEKDSSNHSVAAIMTAPFLKFTASRGNNLDSAGVKPDMRWCLCASRWKEAYEAFKAGDLDKDAVPLVGLHATDKKALDVVSYKMLKEFAMQGEVGAQNSRQGATIDPSHGRGGVVQERGGISDQRPGSDQHYGKTKNDRQDKGANSGAPGL